MGSHVQRPWQKVAFRRSRRPETTKLACAIPDRRMPVRLGDRSRHPGVAHLQNLPMSLCLLPLLCCPCPCPY